MVKNNSSSDAFSDPLWTLSESGFSLVNGETRINVPAIDILRIQYKGQSNFQGIIIESKPSKIFPQIKIHRFPAKLMIYLKSPHLNAPKPSIEIYLEIENNTFHLNELPVGDQIVLDKNWFSLIKENIDYVTSFLKSHGIDKAGIITLRQYWELLQSNAEYLKINSTGMIIDVEKVKKQF